MNIVIQKNLNLEKSVDNYQKRQENEGKSNHTKAIVFVLIVILSLCSIYTYTDYLYGIRALDLFTGYLDKGKYIDRYTIQNGYYYTKNSERIVARDQVDYAYYEDERIGTLEGTKLGTDSSGVSWLKRNLGPIPIGEKISSYEIYGTKSYVAKYIPYKYCYSYREPQYKRVYDYWGYSRTVLAGYKNVKRYATGYDPVYQKYKFSRCFSTFDISKELSFFSNEESVYNTILDNIVSTLINVYGITPKEDSIKGHRAIVYDVQDEIPMRRVLFCANERMYILETKSTHDLAVLSYNYCRNLSLKPVHKIEKGWENKVIIPLCVFFACVFLAVVFNFKPRGFKNILGKRIVTFNSISLIASMVVLAVLVESEKNVYPCLYPAWSSMLSMSIFFNSMIIAWLMIKSKDEYVTDFVVPLWMKRLFYDKLVQERSRRLFLSFVLYPVIILIATPLCVFAIVYALIIMLFTIAVVYFNKWNSWLDADSKDKKASIIIR